MVCGCSGCRNAGGFERQGCGDACSDSGGEACGGDAGSDGGYAGCFGSGADFFASFAYSSKKEYADWIASAKKPETRTARAAKATELLRAGTRRLR